MIKMNKKGQNTAEYAILIGLVIAGAFAMQTYVKRGVQGRVHDASDRYYDKMTADANWNQLNSVNADLLSKKQYEPKELKSLATQETVSGSYETTQMDTGGTGYREYKEVTKPQKADDYQKYEYNK